MLSRSNAVEAIIARTAEDTFNNIMGGGDGRIQLPNVYKVLAIIYGGSSDSFEKEIEKEFESIALNAKLKKYFDTFKNKNKK